MNKPMLIKPSNLELDDAYRGMPPFSSILVSTSDPETTLRQMEKIGFVGLQVGSTSEENEPTTIHAFKGKHGPCHFTGWTAVYSGIALAALDDDLHLLVKDTRLTVCAKTKTVFSLSAYHGLIKCSNQNKTETEIQKLETVLDFEQGMAMVYEKVKNHSLIVSERITLFYPGPFKALILHDGTVVRRGRSNSVPMNVAGSLMKSERFLPSKSQDEVPPPVLFQERYSTDGSLFINEDFNAAPVSVESVSPDFFRLKTIRKPLQKRLLETIERQRKYFVLVGSDINEQGGCCPSQEVTDANDLSRYGILSAYSEPSTGDACPVTIYSFRDELTFSDSGIESVINSALRRQVRDHLYHTSSLHWKTITRRILLVFVAISLLLAIKKCHETRTGNADDQHVVALLNPQKKDVVQLILFHNEKRCFQCLEMERLALEAIRESHGELLDSGQLVFSTITMDDPRFSTLAGRYGLFASSLVLVRFEGATIIREKPLHQTGSLYRDEYTFKAQLKADVQQFIDTAHD